MKKIKLTKGKTTIIDDEDLEKVMKYTWYFQGNGYAVRDQRHNGCRMMLLHRYIMDAPKGVVVDHINGNTLDNRKINLRTCTHSQNSWNAKKRKDNTSGHKGVSWAKDRNKWVVRIKVNKVYIFGGYFDNKIKAAQKYKELLSTHRDEFAK
jgi:hypothetical protein